MVYSRSRRIIYPRQRTDVIFMAVRDDNCFNFVAPFLDERGVWDNLLHTKLIITDTFLNRLQFSEKTAFVLRKIYTEYIYNVQKMLSPYVAEAHTHDFLLYRNFTRD